MDSARFTRAVDAFDRANHDDPHPVLVGGVPRPRELVQAERLSAWVLRLEPAASEVLRLAARCQHIRRFEVPRESYPAGRVGYLQWRTQLARFHADTAARILEECGYERDVIDAVRRLNLKQNLRHSREMQTLEDALCLSFLQFELDEFIVKYPPEKAVEVLAKTWRKISPRAREVALTLSLGPVATELVQRALAKS